MPQPPPRRSSTDRWAIALMSLPVAPPMHYPRPRIRLIHPNPTDMPFATTVLWRDGDPPYDQNEEI
jgi:hypothetical protein